MVESICAEKHVLFRKNRHTIPQADMPDFFAERGDVHLLSPLFVIGVERNFMVTLTLSRVVNKGERP